MRGGAEEERSDGAPLREVRLDKWLWAARFYKTRALAAEAVDGGKVDVNGDRPKRSRALRVGDRLSIRLGPGEHVVVVRALSERRGPASIAVTLYAEEPESIARRERVAEQHRLAAVAFSYGEGKPSKKQRREIRKLKGR